MAKLRDLTKKVVSEARHFTRETFASLAADTLKTTVKESLEHQKTESRKISNLRPRLLSVILDLKDVTAKENLLRRYEEENRRTKRGRGDENQFVASLVKIIEDEQVDTEEVLTKLGKMSDERFHAMLDFIEHNPLEQLLKKLALNIPSILKKADTKTASGIKQTRTWLTKKGIR